MRALVLGGAGAVCKETTRDLATYSNFEEIVIGDSRLDAVQRLIATIGDRRLDAQFFDADDYDRMLQFFPQFDVVVNGLPFAYDYRVNKACAETGVNGLDLSSDDHQFSLHELAVSKDIIFVPGAGATPGITNMMVKRAAEILDRMDEVDIFFAAFRCLAPAPGLLQTTLWEFNPEEEDRNEVFYQDGCWHPSPPLSGELTVRFHEQIGEQKAYYVPHDEVYTLPRSYPELHRVAVRGCFPPHVMEIMGALMRCGALTGREVMIAERSIPSIEAVRVLLADNPFSKENPVWGYGLVVEVKGRRAGRKVTCTFRSHHPPAAEWGGEAAYYKNVGIPLSIGAQLIAGGEVAVRGVHPPEIAFPTGPFFEALSKRGIIIEETIREDGWLA
jgi:saccharopine dehydrogenase-like NADP-dependent oxidoreductase